ncbi:TAP-like protein-domain-containing protein [Trametes polyzona]|nr:TAP-like protein-domain-containing protein [Trametes polyzona]
MLRFILANFLFFRLACGSPLPLPGIYVSRQTNCAPNSSGIQWAPCDPALAIAPGLSCAYFDIPLDYHNASAGAGKLALIKANATAETRRGTMFFNPGGPGVSGIETLNSTSAQFLNSTGGEYDIVSWDPRGVGSLTVPGDTFCFDSIDDYNAFWSGTIELNGIEMTGNFTDQADIDRLLSQAPVMQAKYDELGQRCLNHSNGGVLQYVGTAATVYDVVAMADALDGPGAPVNYWGQSYGTLLGSWFINMFPERVGHVILDGVVDPAGYATIEASLGWSTQIVDDDHVYEGFYTACALAGAEHCALASPGQSPEDVDNNIQTLLKAARDATVENNHSVAVTSGLIRSTIRPQLYFPAAWASVANTEFPQFIASVKQETSDTNVGLPASRSYKRGEVDTPSYTTEAIFCGDSVDLTSTNMTDVFENIIASSQNVSHMFASAWPFAAYYCSNWPVRAVERYQGPFNKTLANPILVIGNTFDPATPLASAKKVVDLLGDQARLVQLNTFGHTTEAAPSACINDVVRAYVTKDTLPPDNHAICEVDLDFEIFPGVTMEKTMANLPDHAGLP